MALPPALDSQEEKKVTEGIPSLEMGLMVGIMEITYCFALSGKSTVWG